MPGRYCALKYTFDVALLPSENLKKHNCRLVIDLLRASTQITTFFDCGGSILLPVTETDEAFELQETLGNEWKLMGERGGMKPKGFDFGNSPLELQQNGAPQQAVITTSNGTSAILRAAENCAEVRIVCARNAEAVCWDAICSGTEIGILAAGRNGEFSMEDVVCAGMLVEKLLALAPKNGASEMELTDGAIAAMSLWQSLGPDLTAIAMESEHGRILQGLGFTNDIFFCTEIDMTAVVPQLSFTQGIPAIIAH